MLLTADRPFELIIVLGSRGKLEERVEGLECLVSLYSALGLLLQLESVLQALRYLGSTRRLRNALEP